MIQPDKIVRSRRKTLSLSVLPTGELIVRAPLRCGEERIFAFISEKESWIERQQARFRAEAERFPLPGDNLYGYRFLLLGKPCVIRLYAGTRVRYDEGARAVWLPTDGARARLVRWLKSNAGKIFSAVCVRRAAEMSASYPSVRVTSAKTRWGSCSPDNALHFSFRLLYAPPEVIDYVVVHELSHTFHKNHSPAFWRTVERYVPDYKKKRAWLKDNSLLMEIF